MLQPVKRNIEAIANCEATLISSPNMTSFTFSRLIVELGIFIAFSPSQNPT